MGKVIDMMGKKFDNLTVIGLEEIDPKNGAKWRCSCECGRETVVMGSNLRTGNTTSCGHCLRIIDLTGNRIGRLVVLGFSSFDKFGSATWICRCDCGATVVVAGYNLRRSQSQSCGCLMREEVSKRKTTHGMSNSAEYETWKHMIQRCTNPNKDNYPRYGGRGVRVCQGWLSSFENFFADVGVKPDPKYSIDRIDNMANYSCGHCEQCKANGWTANCKWSSAKEQMNNRRCSKKNRNQ